MGARMWADVRPWRRVFGVRRFVITGGLGVGKTALLEELNERVVTVAEPARELIAEHKVATGETSLDHRPELFVSRLIARSIEKHESVVGAGIAVFDRGIPDCVAYATALDVDASTAVRAAMLRRYEDPVFVATPWRDIYRSDEMRRATFEQAKAFYSHIVTAYESLGYELLELPNTTVAARAALVLAHIDT